MLSGSTGSEYDDITKEDYEESIIIAKNILEWVENEIEKDEVKKS
jgi:HEPN domain-containing protein